MTKTSKNLFVLGIIFFILFIFFSFLVHKDVFTQIDFDTTVKLQDNISPRLDMPFSYLSVIGSFEIVSLFLLLLWAFIRKLKYIFVLFGFALFHVIELLGKFFIVHPPPPFMFLKYNLDISFPSGFVHPGFAYPSGHMGRTAFLFIILIFIIYNSKKISKLQKNIFYSLLIIFTALMFVSRIYLGEHWLSDVIGGALLGASLGTLSSLFIFIKTRLF